jgi:sarcosine oxidase
MPAPHIVVIGLGAMGSAALCQLARRGIRVTGIEQFAVGHERGSSHGPTRMIRLAHFENNSYVPLLRRAYELWRELENLAQQTLVVKTGIAEIGPPDGELVRGTLAAASRYGLPHTVLDGKSLMRRHPNFKLPQTYVAVLQPDGGYIEAAAAIEANIRIARAAGAVVRTSETVAAIEPHAKGVRIRTDRAAIDADGVVVAAGPWMGKLLPELSLPLRVTRQVVGWFAPADAEQFAADRFPVFILETRHGHHYGFPIHGRSGMKIAKHHHAREEVDADTYRRTVSADDEAIIRAPRRTPSGREWSAHRRANLPLHDDARRDLHHRPHAGISPRRHRLAVLRPRLQIFPGRRRNPCRSGCARRDRARYPAVPFAPVRLKMPADLRARLFLHRCASARAIQELPTLT